MFKTFGWSFAITVVGLAAGFIYGGPAALALVVVLIVLEISLSFDNAIVNASVLERMSAGWQRAFLTIGVLIAVFGMRLVFPFVVVSLAAQLSPGDAIRLAFERGDPQTPGTYGYILHAAHPSIAGFGGMFLLMLFLDFVFAQREILWLRPVERVLQRIGRLENASTVVAVVILILVATLLAEDLGTVLLSGMIGVGSYLLINALGGLFESSSDDVLGAEAEGGSTGPTAIAVATGKAGFFMFLYLEVLDASFSFDGVIGAFAITSDPIVIAIGLGVGAMYIRSLTIHFVRRKTLAEFVFLEHGAMWAVGALALILLISVRVDIPEMVTGLVGVVFILAGWMSSIVRNRRERANDRERVAA